MSKCWYCGKEIKNENNKEHIGICDECYQESFEVGNKFVSNLIEKQKQLQKERELDNAFWKQECDSLQKALDESENKIDKLEDKLHHYYEETLNKGTCGLCEHLRGEYKTDFAIEQLLIARSRIYNFRYNESRCLNKEDSIEDCLEVLDQQIKELKGK